MSSMLNKGKKSFKPVAPRRRPTPAGSSARPSIEPPAQTQSVETESQVPSQTSAIESAPHVHSSAIQLVLPKPLPIGGLEPRSKTVASAKRKAAEDAVCATDSDLPAAKAPKISRPTEATGSPQESPQLGTSTGHESVDALEVDQASSSSNTDPGLQAQRHPSSTPPSSNNAASGTATNTLHSNFVAPEATGNRAGQDQSAATDRRPQALVENSGRTVTSIASEQPERMATPGLNREMSIAETTDEEGGFDTGAAEFVPNNHSLQSAEGDDPEHAYPDPQLAAESRDADIPSRAGPLTGPKPKKKRTKKPKNLQSADEGDDSDRADVDIRMVRRRATGPKKARKKKERKKRAERADTPSGAESEEVVPEVMTMAGLCKDLRIGKKSKVHDIIQQRIREKKARSKEPSVVEGGHEGMEGGAQAALPEEEQPVEPKATRGLKKARGPQMRLVDGAFVLDTESLQVDRHAIAAANDMGREIVEEDDFTHAINSQSFMKKIPTVRWDEAATEIFYTGLRQFGTAFEMIAEMFPHRNRRQIKLKFNKEEREHPAKITRALIGEKETIDVDLFETMTVKKYESVEDIKAELDRYEAEQQAEIDEIENEHVQSELAKKKVIADRSARIERIYHGAAEEGDSEEERLHQARERQLQQGQGKKKMKKGPKKNGVQSEGGELMVLGDL